jgi:hypothetical protein
MKIRMKKQMYIEKRFNFRRGEKNCSGGKKLGKGIHGQLGCTLEACLLGLGIH